MIVLDRCQTPIGRHHKPVTRIGLGVKTHGGWRQPRCSRFLSIIGWCRTGSLIAGLLLVMIAASTAASAQLREQFIDPTVTDQEIDPLTELPGSKLRRLEHYVTIDAHRRNGFLFVFLAGSGGLPENYQVLARHAAMRGFHVVSLAYPNWPSVVDLTFQSGDPATPGPVREERLFGNDASPLVDVDQGNSVINRLVRLLEYLHMNHPGENWAQFLVGTHPRWATIMVGGHSQGAGHGAYLAQEFRVAGVLMFGGPGDFVVGAGAADWLFRPLQISPGGMYGFVHELDPNFNGFQISQSILGLADFGPVHDVDMVPQADWFSRRLTSSRLDIPDDNFHGAVAVDEALPLGGSGDMAYIDAWNYMFDSLLFTDSFE